MPAARDKTEYGLAGVKRDATFHLRVLRCRFRPRSIPSRNYNKIFNDSNFLCLIAGEATETRLHSLVETGFSALSYFLFGIFLFTHILGNDPTVLFNIITRLQAVSNLYHTVNSIRIIGTGDLAFGSSHSSDHLPPPFRYDPAVGWITTQGVLGKKSWNGSFYGGIFGLVTFDSISYAYYIGATGFLGIKVSKADGKLFFLGSTFRVKISPENNTVMLYT